MSRWRIYETLFASTANETSTEVELTTEDVAEWDRLRAEALSDRERHEIDEIFTRHAA